jgi:hypothetical protein
LEAITKWIAGFSAIATLVALGINLFTMPTKLQGCYFGDYCDVFRVGTYYWNLGSFYALIGFGSLLIVSGLLYANVSQKYRFAQPIQITLLDVKGKIAILLVVVAVGLVFIFVPQERECKPLYEITYGIDSRFCAYTPIAELNK